MTSPDSLTAFLEIHNLDLSEIFPEERDAICCVVDCHAAIDKGYTELPQTVLHQDSAVGLLWQLYQRCTEQAHGALTAMVTGCGPTSEVASRATLEATVTIRYILADRNLRLASYFKSHIEQADKQEKQWRKAAEALSGQAKAEHLAACDYRRQGIAAMKKIVDMLTSQLVSSAVVPAWPNIASRFDAIGEAIVYRTFYARLCAEVHFDAEETLRFFIGQVTSPAALEKIAVESVMYSRFLLMEAVRSYVETGRALASTYNMHAAASTCTAAEKLMHLHTAALSEHIGAQPSKSKKSHELSGKAGADATKQDATKAT